MGDRIPYHRFKLRFINGARKNDAGRTFPERRGLVRRAGLPVHAGRLVRHDTPVSAADRPVAA